jgi:hypothetical protein
MEETFDAVIVGSGTAAPSRTRPAEAGRSVLERGPRRAKSDLMQSDDPRYITSVIDLVVSLSNFGFRTGTMVGGASIPMDGAHFRTQQMSFAATDASGRRYWPAALSRAELEVRRDDRGSRLITSGGAS